MLQIHKSFWQGLLLANIVFILYYWWQGSSALLTDGLPGMAIALGRLAGLAAAVTVLLQFIFMSRTPWLERIFGLDKLAGIHRVNGKLTFYFLVSHPLLLAYGYSRAADIGFFEQFRIFLFDYDNVLWAGIGLVLFLIVIGTSLVIIRSRLKYESWYFLHLLVYIAVFASLWHQFSIGGTILSNQVFYGYWLSLYVIVFVVFAVFRFGRQFYLFQKHRFAVSRVARENHNVVSIYITGRNLQKFNIHAGQFMIFRFLTKGMWWQAHPFSLSFAPRGNELRITVKDLGDFTGQVDKIVPGTKIMIDGPFGIFTERVSVSSKILLIAGGIGITPIRSLMETMLEKGRDVVLLYSNRTEKDIVFKREIDNLAVRHNSKVFHVLSDENKSKEESGRIDKAKITRLVPDVKSRDIYVCGPPAMIESVIKELKKIKVPPERIHFEKFSL